MSHSQRLPYIAPASITDPAMMAEFQRAAREGASRPESHAIRVHVPDVFWAFTKAWNDTDDGKDLLDVDKSTRFTVRQKAAA